VVEWVFLLQQDNVIWQVLDSWGASNNPCMIYTLLTLPLHSLQVTYSRTYDANPSLMHTKIGLPISETCMTIVAA
jgi:hypothetical protein